MKTPAPKPKPFKIKRRQRIISLKELRTDPDGVARRVRGGEVLVVLKRSQPLFRLIKAYENEDRVDVDYER